MPSRCSRLALSLLPLLCWPLMLRSEPFAGTLMAERDCPAGISTKRADNPGEVRLTPGRPYPVVARNRADPTHYQLRIESAQPKDRWVEVGCGRLAADPPTASPAVLDPAPAPVAAAPRAVSGQFVLAVTWQPAFCEPRPRLPECRAQPPAGAEAHRFSLHGLWPQPVGRAYCGVPGPEQERAEGGEWQRLPRPDLSPDTRAALAQRMPGTLSGLDRHEWLKHGTCYGTDAETYFRHSLSLLGQLNDSAVQRLFEARLGGRLGADEVRAAFDQTFGAGSGGRVELSCDRDGRIAELRIGLEGQVSDGAGLGHLMQAAPRRPVGCDGGWVDRPGPGR